MNGWLYNEEEYLEANIAIIVNDTVAVVESVSVSVNPLMVIISELDSLAEVVNLISSVVSINISETLSQSEFVQIQSVLFVMIDVNDTVSSTEFVYFAFVPSLNINVNESVTKSESINIRSSAIIYVDVSDTNSVTDIVDGIWSSFVLSWNDIETYLSTLPLSWTVISDALEGTRAAVLSLSWRVMDVLSSLLMSWRVIPIQITGLNTNIQLPVFFVSFNTLQINIGDNLIVSDSITINGLTEVVIVSELSSEVDSVVISIPRMINVLDSQTVTEIVTLKQSLAVGDILIFTETVNVSII